MVDFPGGDFPCSHPPVSSMVDFPSAMMVFEKLVPVKKNKNRAELSGYIRCIYIYISIYLLVGGIPTPLKNISQLV